MLLEKRVRRVSAVATFNHVDLDRANLGQEDFPQQHDAIDQNEQCLPCLDVLGATICQYWC
jgi:hypothetical protein